ncbi:MAG: type II 3-dehydroquinate dehydratase [bacterium]
MNILVIHGPNVNLSGVREPKVYGTVTIDEINDRIQSWARDHDSKVRIAQSNYEGAIVEEIQKAISWADALVINAGAYSHTSIAIRDAIVASKIPTVEVHLSNIYQREDFRHHSYIAPVAIGQIVGFGALSYILGLEAVLESLK